MDLLNKRNVSTQPISSWDWSPDKEGLAVCGVVRSAKRRDRHQAEQSLIEDARESVVFVIARVRTTNSVRLEKKMTLTRPKNQNLGGRLSPRGRRLRLQQLLHHLRDQSPPAAPAPPQGSPRAGGVRRAPPRLKPAWRRDHELLHAPPSVPGDAPRAAPSSRRWAPQRRRLCAAGESRSKRRLICANISGVTADNAASARRPRTRRGETPRRPRPPRFDRRHRRPRASSRSAARLVARAAAAAASADVDDSSEHPFQVVTARLRAARAGPGRRIPPRLRSASSVGIVRRVSILSAASASNRSRMGRTPRSCRAPWRSLPLYRSVRRAIWNTGAFGSGLGAGSTLSPAGRRSGYQRLAKSGSPPRTIGGGGGAGWPRPPPTGGVAARTMTRACSFVWKPSHIVMNSVFMLVFASCSLFLRAPRNESTSSMKMMLGWSFHRG